MKKKDLLKTPIRHIDITSFDATPIIEAMKGMSFTARDLATAADIYDHANAWCLKIGTGLMSDGLMFGINARVVGCKARTKELYPYTFPDGSTGNIRSEMNLGGIAVTLGVGMRY